MSNIRILEIRAAEAHQAELVRRLAVEEARHRLPDFARHLGLPAALLLSAFLVSAFA